MKPKDFPLTLEGKPFATGVRPKLTAEQRAYCREVELRRRKYTRVIRRALELRRALPTRAQLAAELNCSVRTVDDAARGRRYQRDRFPDVSRGTSNHSETRP